MNKFMIFNLNKKMIMDDETKQKKFSEHLSKHTFIYGNIEIKFDKLYEYLKTNEFPQNLFNIDSYENEKYYLLTSYDDEQVYFFFNYLVDLELIDMQTKKKEITQICSTYEIYSIIKEKKDYIFYFENEKIMNNNIVPSMINKLNNKIILNYYEEKIETINFKQIYVNHKEGLLSPLELTNNFYSYFPEQNEKEKILFIKCTERSEIENFMIKYLANNKILKLTGPSGIGKSTFLLYFSRKSFFRLYLNLGSLNYLAQQQEIIKLINMIISELKRLNLDEQTISELNDFFSDITNINVEFIINHIIKVLIKLNKKIYIILDQFKEQYFFQWDAIENLVNDKENKLLRLIICSRINDKNIKKSCCSVINYCNKTQKKNAQKNVKGEYFYISKILNKNNTIGLYDSEGGSIDKDLKEKIIEYFDGIPKYIFKILNSDKIPEKIKEIKERVIKKFKDFYGTELKEIELKLKLASLRMYIGKQLSIDEFNKIISDFSFKYFSLKFYNDDEEIIFLTEDSQINYFQIDYLFPYISEIVEELAAESNDLFFDCSLFGNHTGSTIGGFLELIIINKIKKGLITLPDGGHDNTICVDRINEMKEIKYRLDGILSGKNQLNNLNKINNNKIIQNLNEEMAIENLFENEISAFSKKKEIINFQANYLIPENKIDTIKRDFIKNNNIQIYDNSNNLLYSTKLFITKDSKNYIVKNSDKDNNKYYYLGDKNLLITQFYENAASYDLGYLFGPSDKKIFVGFQMKSYRDYSENRSFPLKKENIIEHSKLLLFNTNYLFNINIVELHYIIIGLYFKDKTKLKNEITYSNKLIDFCNKNKFKLILYEPFEKQFLDSKLNIIDKIKIPDNYTNLLEDEIFMVFDEIPRETNMFLQRKRKLTLTSEIIELTRKTKNINKKAMKVKEITNFIGEIKSHLNIENLQFLGSEQFKDNNYLPVPRNDYFFLFQKNDFANLSGLNKFYCLYKKESKTLVYDFESKNNIENKFLCDYFSLFDKMEYYYIFKKK